MRISDWSSDVCSSDLQRTNLVPWSEVFDTPAWNKDTVTVVPNGAVAPDGTMTMDYIVPTANNNQHRILWRGNVTAATTYTFSVFVKADVLNTITLLIYEDAPTAAVQLGRAACRERGCQYV